MEITVLCFCTLWANVMATYHDLYNVIKEDISWTEVQMVEYPVLRVEAEVCIYISMMLHFLQLTHSLTHSLTSS